MPPSQQTKKDQAAFNHIREKWGVAGYLYVNSTTDEIHLDGEEEVWEMKPEFLAEAAALKTEVLINNVTARRGLKILEKISKQPIKGIVELRDRAPTGSPEKTFLTHLLRVTHHPEMVRRVQREKLPGTPEEALAVWNAPKHPVRNGVLLAVNELLEPKEPEM